MYVHFPGEILVLNYLRQVLFFKSNKILGMHQYLVYDTMLSEPKKTLPNI